MAKLRVDNDGVTTETFHDNEDKGVIQQRSVDVKPILENNKDKIINLNIDDNAVNLDFNTQDSFNLK